MPRRRAASPAVTDDPLVNLNARVPRAGYGGV